MSVAKDTARPTTRMTNIPTSASCRCGKVELRLAGAPIVRAICYCASCQEAGRRHQAAPGADAIVARDGGTDYVLYRKDRVRCVFAEFAYYHPRKKMISGLLSVAALDGELELDSDGRDFVWKFICGQKHSQFMIWEGIIPYCLAEIWALSNIQGTNEPDRRLFALIRDTIACNSSDFPKNHLPAPYYRLDEVLLWKYGEYLQIPRSELDRDSFYRRSWFLEPLFQMLVRRNYKPSCKSMWPDVTRFTHCRTRLKSAVDFGSSRTEDAVAEDKIIDVQRPKLWTEAVAESREGQNPNLPPQLMRRPILVLLYCLFVPYRMDADIIFWLDRHFCRTWY